MGSSSHIFNANEKDDQNYQEFVSGCLSPVLFIICNASPCLLNGGSFLR